MKIFCFFAYIKFCDKFPFPRLRKTRKACGSAENSGCPCPPAMIGSKLFRSETKRQGMNFSFLHAADLHLGSPLLGLSLKDEEIAQRFSTASRQAFTDLVSFAIEKEVAFLVIAGDIFDGEWRDSSIGLFFNRELARLDRAKIPVFLINGNHDAESVVTKTITLPGNTKRFRATSAETFRLEDYKVALHGRSFSNRAENENYASAYPRAIPGWFNIGVLHTSCEGRPPHACYAPCSLEDLSLRGYDYWALGHVHAFEVLCESPRIVFPGNLQGRSIRECGPKGAVLVEVADQTVTSLRHVAFDQARFARIGVDLAGVAEEALALRRIEEAIKPEVAAAGDRLLALRIEVGGETTLHRSWQSAFRDLYDEVQAAAHRCHQDAWLEKLILSTVEPDVTPRRPGAIASLDLAAMLTEAETDAQLRDEIGQIIGAVLARMPDQAIDKDTPLEGEIESLITKARALVLHRALD